MEVTSRTLTIKYGTPRVTEAELDQVGRTISSETDWKVIFRKLVDAHGMVRQVASMIPQTLPYTKVGWQEQGEYVLMSCFGDVTHRQILEELSASLTSTMAVDVRYDLKLRDERKTEIIQDIIPVSWGFEKASYHSKERLAVLTCSNPPENLEDEVVQTVLAAIKERLDWNILFSGQEYQRIKDEGLLSEIRALIPASVGFEYAIQNVTQPNYRIFVRRHPDRANVKQIKKLLGTNQVFVKVVPTEAVKSPFVRSALNLLDLGAPTPVRVRSQKYGKMIGFGACEEVGRSSFYFELSGLKILIDCGTSFGPRPYPDIPKSLIQQLDFVLLSHAHTDHSTLIPWLYKQGCRAQLISTEPTFVISKVLMEDYLKVQKKYRHEQPIFATEDIQKALQFGFVAAFDRRYQLGDHTFVTFLNSGHILGASMILIEDHGERILYSGDLTCVDTRVQVAAKVPAGLDHIIIETTYGGKRHRTRQESERYFLNRLETTLEQGGTVIIPSFAVGRSQEILSIIKQHPKLGYNKKFPVYVDGMILTMNDIYRSYLSVSDEVYLNPRLREEERNIFTAGRSFFNRITRREQVLDDRSPKVILTTSGMCEGLASYYLGRFLLDGAKQVNIDGQLYPVRIQIDSVGFSGHADQEQILEAISHNHLKTLVAVHGESRSMNAFIEAAPEKVKAQRVVRAKIKEELKLY